MTEKTVWGMSQEEREQWNTRARVCGFADIEQQERLRRIYDALYTALSARFPMDPEVQCYVERNCWTHDRNWQLSQDAHRVAVGHSSGYGFWWSYDKEVIALDPMSPRPREGMPLMVAMVLSEALGRLA
jgi:hypothetical protein